MSTAPWDRRETRPGLRRVAIDPVSRVEGHGKVTILLDEANRVQQVRLHIVEFRGFEKFIGPALLGSAGDGAAPVRHLPGVHHLAARKALDRVVGRAADARHGRPRSAA